MLFDDSRFHFDALRTYITSRRANNIFTISHFRCERMSHMMRNFIFTLREDIFANCAAADELATIGPFPNAASRTPNAIAIIYFLRAI